jgi:hypothetical protein
MHTLAIYHIPEMLGHKHDTCYYMMDQNNNFLEVM